MSAANLLNQLAQSLEESNDLSAVKIYNQQWMFKCVLEQIAKGTIKHADLTFPEDSKWCSDAAILKFNSTGGYSGIAVAVGHIQINKNKRKYPKWNYIEVEQNCSCLYAITTGWNFKSNVLSLMRLVYDGLKEDKITEIPHNIVCCGLPYNESKLNDFEEVRYKEKIKAEISNDFNTYLREKILHKEEVHWVLNNLDPFMEKLKIKIFPWEELIMQIENTETRADITAFYNNWNKNKL